MMRELILIGDVAARTQVSVKAGQKKWARLGRTSLQKRLDDAWDAKIADDPYGHLARVLDHLRGRDDSFYGPILMGDIVTGASRAGLSEQFVWEEAKLFKEWLFKNYADILSDLMAITGNHDIRTLHPDTPLSETKIAMESFSRFEELWGSYTRRLSFGDWRVLLISSDLLLVEDDAPESLRRMRGRHIRQIRLDLAEAKDGRALLVLHEPQAFRILGDPSSVPDSRANLEIIRGLLERKVALSLIGHLEDPKAGRLLRVTWPLLSLAVHTPLAWLLRVVFKSPDCVKIARRAAAGNARAARWWTLFRPLIVPSPKHGYVGVRFVADGHAIVTRYPADRRFVPVMSRYI